MAARHTFGGGIADWAFQSNSDGSLTLSPAAVLTFYDSLTGGTQYTAAPMPGGVDDGTGLLDSTGMPVSSVTCDSNGEVADALQGPDGVTKMAADASGGAGPRRWIIANDLGDDVTALLGDFASIVALGEAPTYVYYDATLGAYPARPLVSSPVWWVGPVTPPIGGGSATGSDIWLNTTGETAPSGITSVTATDGSIVVTGSPATPTLATGTLDEIATLHPPAGPVPLNGQKLTGLANGVAASDAATVGQIGSGGGGMSNPMTTLGDLIFEDGTPAAARLAGNTTAARKFLRQQGTGSVSAAPGWDTITAADLPAASTSLQGAVLLDGTASDVTQNGTQAAGATGKVIDAGHVHPAVGWVPSDNGLLAASASLDGISSSQTITAGDVYLAKIPIRYALTLSTLYVVVSTAGAGASSGSFCGLYSSAGTRLTASADLGTALNSLGVAQLTLTTPQPLAAGSFVWAAIVVNLATTQPALRTYANNVTGLANLNLTAATARAAVNGTGQTALPASITPAANVITGGAVGPLWVGAA